MSLLCLNNRKLASASALFPVSLQRASQVTSILKAYVGVAPCLVLASQLKGSFGCLQCLLVKWNWWRADSYSGGSRRVWYCRRLLCWHPCQRCLRDLERLLLFQCSMTFPIASKLGNLLLGCSFINTSFSSSIVPQCVPLRPKHGFADSYTGIAVKLLGLSVVATVGTLH